MWPEIFKFVSTALAVACCALAVKLADDWLDQEHDRLVGRSNWTNVLGIGTMFYAMLLLIIAAALNTAVSLTLFLASYVIGMFHDLQSQFPLGLSGWQESLLVLLISFLLFGWQITWFSLFFVTGFQLLDDCLDATSDRLAGQRNFACKLGRLECFIIALFFILLAWWINEDVFAPVLTGTILAWGGLYRLTLAVKRYA